MTATVLGTCQHCEKKCDKGSACCHECRWSNQRAQQGPRRFWSKVDAASEFGTSVDTARKIAKGEHWLCR